MEWITKIFGMLGGGWGTFASIIAGIVALVGLYFAYKSYLRKKAHDDTKEKEAKDHASQIEKIQEESSQAKKDEAKVNDLEKKAKELLETPNQG